MKICVLGRVKWNPTYRSYQLSAVSYQKNIQVSKLARGKSKVNECRDVGGVSTPKKWRY